MTAEVIAMERFGFFDTPIVSSIISQTSGFNIWDVVFVRGTIFIILMILAWVMGKLDTRKRHSRRR